MADKSQGEYRDYEATVLKSRAEIPEAANISVNASAIACRNIKASQLKSVLGTAGNKCSEFFSAANLNPWSGFVGIRREVSAPGAVLRNERVTAARKLGDFAGYDHGASAPEFVVGGTNEIEYANSITSVVFHCKVKISQAKFTDIIGREGAAMGVAFSVWDGATLKGARVRAFADITDEADFDTSAAYRIDLLTSVSTTYTQKIEIVDMDGISAYDYAGDHLICQLSALPNWTKTVVPPQLNTLSLVAHPNFKWILPQYVITSADGSNAVTVSYEAIAYMSASAGGLTVGTTNINGIRAFIQAYSVGDSSGNATGPVITAYHSILGATAGFSVHEFGQHGIWATGENSGSLSTTAPVTVGSNTYPRIDGGYGYRIVVEVF